MKPVVPHLELPTAIPSSAPRRSGRVAMGCLVAFLALSGCSVRIAARPVVRRAPPFAPIETVHVVHDTSRVWVFSHFEWNGREYVWTPGAWIPARPGYRYEQPHWEPVLGGYIYVPGVWIRLP